MSPETTPLTPAEVHPCPECGAAMTYETRPHAVEYQGRSRTLQTLAWWCTKCGEGILAGPALLDHEKAFLELKGEVEQQARQSTRVRGVMAAAMNRNTLLDERDAAVLDELVRAGDLKGYEIVRTPTHPEDLDELLILVFPSGKVLHVCAASLSSCGILGVRVPTPP